MIEKRYCVSVVILKISTRDDVYANENCRVINSGQMIASITVYAMKATVS